MTYQEDRNVLKTLSIVIAALTAFFIFSIMAARVVSASDSMVEAATLERIKPFGEVNIIGQTPAAKSSPVTTASSSVDGKGTYNASCGACHNSGAAGAPKFGDKGAWKARIAKGMDKLNESGINGVPGTAMSAKGGNASLSDDAVKAAVKYMVDGSK